MSTIKWSKAHPNFTLAQIEASAAVLKGILKRRRTGELKQALVGRTKDEWSLMMGHCRPLND